MSDQATMEIRGFYRSHSHLPIWEVMDKAGIWEQNGLKVSFEFCDSSSAAEKALFGGDVDFVSGNHISPYLLVKRGQPIVCLTSPSNTTNDRLVTNFPIKRVSELRGKKIGDTTLVDSIGGYHHPRGNHMLYVMAGGLRLDEVEFVELTESNNEFRAMQMEVLKSRKVDAIFVTGNTEKFEQAGMTVLPLDRLPMINGPTLTSTLTTLQKKTGLRGTVGKGAGDGNSLRAHPPGRNRRDSRRAQAKSAGVQERSVSERFETPAQALSGPRGGGERVQALLLEEPGGRRDEPDGVMGSTLPEGAGQFWIHR